MLNRRPWGPLCWVLAFFTASYQQLLWSPNSIGVPEGSLGRVWLSLPHLIINSISNCHLISVLTELYNSSTPTRLPTRSLEWHDWSSSSGNNCHAVHRSLSSGASVYECIMGFTLSHFISQIHPRDLFWLVAIGMCHFLPVHHFVMACLLGLKVKIQHVNVDLLWISIMTSRHLYKPDKPDIMALLAIPISVMMSLLMNSKCISWLSCLGQQNIQTVSLLRGKTPPTSVLDMILNNLMVRLH